MKHKNGSLLRRLEDKLCSILRVETLDSSDSVLMVEGDDDLFKERLLALSEPYSTISQILEEFRNKRDEAGSISRKDISYIHKMVQDTGITMEDINKDLDDFEEKMSSFLKKKDIPRPKQYDYCCGLFSYKFFNEFVNALLRKYGEGSDYESFVIFSGANRTLAEGNAICNCDKNTDADARGCEKCDPIEVLLSSEIIRLYRNKALYLKSDDLEIERSESQLEKILTHIKNRKKISLKTGVELKLYATFFHILGCNEFLWDKSPNSIEAIWENYPVTDSTERLKATIEKLLQNNHSWGKEGNYVDNQGRMTRLLNALSAGSIITIWGEGGLGKTELVYQTLSQMLKNKSILKFDELIPFTFKGSQGEYNYEFSDDDSGERRPANQIGWKTAEGISQLIALLADRQSETDPSIDLTTRKGNSNAAVDYLIGNGIWLIIDNHEVQDDGLLDGFLELYAQRKRSGTFNENTRIIITTRVPPSRSIGTVIDIPVLDVQEMKQLAQNKVVWFRKKDGEKTVISKFSQPEMFQDEIWEQINTKIQNQLNSKRYRKAAGHPYIVFAAVYRAMYDEKYSETEFDKIVLELLRQFDANPTQIGAMHELQMYIFGESFKSSINNDNATKFLKLTQYSELSTRVFRDKVAFEQWEEVIEDLSRREIIIPKSNQNNEESYEWRTGYHPKLIREYIEEEYPDLVTTYSPIWEEAEGSSAKITFWDDRMGKISNNKTIRTDTLATINVGTARQNNKDRFKEQVEILNFKWLLEREGKEMDNFAWDFHKLIEILSHFSKQYLELITSGVEEEKFPFKENSETTKTEFLNALELIIQNSLDGLTNYLLFMSKNDLNPSYEVFTVFVDILKRSKDRTTEISKLGEKKQLRDISQFLQTFDESWSKIYSNLIQNTPPYTKSTSTQHDALLQLGSFEEFGSVYLFALLTQFGCAGPIKDTKLLNLLLGYSQQFIAEKHGSEGGITFAQSNLQPFSKFLYNKQTNDVSGIITSTGTDNTLSKEFFLEFDNIVEDGESDVTLFKRKDVELDIQIKGKTLIGTDEDENTWKIYNCTSNTEENKSYDIRCIPFYTDGEGTIHAIFVILKDVLESLTKAPKIPSEDSSEREEPVQIESVSKERMWSILKSIQFHSIPAASLFGSKLKQALERQKPPIDSTGKVWRKWRNANYTTKEFELEKKKGFEPIEYIIGDLSEGEWSVLELDAGKNKTIRKLPKDVVCVTCNQSVGVDLIDTWWHCLSCNHDIDKAGNCLNPDDCKACLGYPDCPSCEDREDLEKLPDGMYLCTHCEIWFPESGEQYYVEAELEEKRLQRKEELEDLAQEQEQQFFDEFDKDYQKGRKGRW